MSKSKRSRRKRSKSTFPAATKSLLHTDWDWWWWVTASGETWTPWCEFPSRMLVPTPGSVPATRQNVLQYFTIHNLLKYSEIFKAFYYLIKAFSWFCCVLDGVWSKTTGPFSQHQQHCWATQRLGNSFWQINKISIYFYALCYCQSFVWPDPWTEFHVAGCRSCL